MGLKTESMRSNTMFIYDISVYLDNNANNNVYFYLSLMLFSLGRCQLRKKAFTALGITYNVRIRYISTS